MRLQVPIMKLSFKDKSLPDELVDRLLNCMSITKEDSKVSCLLLARVPNGMLYVVDIFEETQEGWNFKFQASEMKAGGERTFQKHERGTSGLKSLLSDVEDYFTFWVHVTNPFLDELKRESLDLYKIVKFRTLDVLVETEHDDSSIKLVHAADIEHMGCSVGSLYATSCAAAAQPA